MWCNHAINQINMGGKKAKVGSGVGKKFKKGAVSNIEGFIK